MLYLCFIRFSLKDSIKIRSYPNRWLLQLRLAGRLKKSTQVSYVILCLEVNIPGIEYDASLCNFSGVDEPAVQWL